MNFEQSLSENSYGIFFLVYWTVSQGTHQRDPIHIQQIKEPKETYHLTDIDTLVPRVHYYYTAYGGAYCCGNPDLN